MTRMVLALLALGVLAGCGRYGPPRPPGPPDQISFPRAYPAPDPVRPANAPPR